MHRARHTQLPTLVGLVVGLWACSPDEQDPEDSPEPPDSSPSVDTDSAVPPDTGDTDDTVGEETASRDLVGCRVRLSLDEDRHVLGWKVHTDREIDTITLAVSWYDGMVSYVVSDDSEEGELNLLPHALDDHELQVAHGQHFSVQAAAKLTSGARCQAEVSLPFLPLNESVAPYLPPGLELGPTAVDSEVEGAFEGQLAIRVMAMAPEEGGYTHYVAVQDLLGTPLQVLAVAHDTVDALASEPLGFGILTGAGAHDGLIYAMIDSFPELQVGLTLLLDATTGEVHSHIQTPEDNLLNHRFSLRGGQDGETIMDTLAWRLTENSDANRAVEVHFTPDGSQTTIDEIEVWYDPVEALRLEGLLYCNSTAASPEWQVVTCPNDNRRNSVPPKTELITALNLDSREQLIFVREGQRDRVLAEGWESRFDAVVELPDHPVHAEPVMSMVHDAIIQDDRIAILSLQLEGTTKQPTSVYLLDFDAKTGTASFHCGYESDLEVYNYGNLLWPAGSPVIGFHLPNSGGFRWIDQDCQLVGALRARPDWEDDVNAIFHQKWLESAHVTDLGHPDSTLSYDLREIGGAD